MFEPLKPAGLGFSKLSNWPTVDDCQRMLAGKEITNAAGLPLRFVSQSARTGKPEDKYEARIYLQGEVQVRNENWHDLFNVLVWLTFPKSKAALNRRHFLAASESGEKDEKNRGPVQDALTLFDEGG
ncbi:MAG TPA: DUF3025 domain-containing protein, partial [Burkholderiales bacterium]|nr:DUF3025 domain-containing protein [Burkholderiales bacterium]